MNIMITGGGGYIGSVLTRLLLNKGYNVTCLDRFFFGKDVFRDITDDKRLTLVQDDVRWFNPTVLNGIDAVIDMASLSNDPAGELDQQKTMEINHKGRARVAALAKKHGVGRYILASSCSIYGFKEGPIDETTKPNPLTTYAHANLNAEKETLPLSDKKFTATALRQATVYGLSPRMRFDLAINGMVLGFHKNGKIPIMKDGNQWRPFVHIKDTSKAFMLAMEAEKELVSNEIFNIGSNDQNYQIYPLAELVAKSINIPFQYEWYGSPDNRSYRINFDKAKNILNFKPEYTPKEGAEEVYDALKNGTISDTKKTITVEWYKHLAEMKKYIADVEIDGKLL